MGQVFSESQLRLIAKVISADICVWVKPEEIKMVSVESGIFSFWFQGDKRTMLSREQFWAIAYGIAPLTASWVIAESMRVELKVTVNMRIN